MSICAHIFRRRKPRPSREAVQARAEVKQLRPRAEAVARERDRLLRENNYAARIRAIYQGES